jgi:serine/threonine protein phosphatase 1
MSWVHVIPDIHGRLDALELILKASGCLGPDDAWVGPADSSLVQLGDLVDRGPHSRACVERMMALTAKHPERVRVICGNHEQMLLSENYEMQRTWLSNGGQATLDDYGKDFKALCQGDGEHARWFRSLPLRWVQDGVLFCHAGLHFNDPDGLSERLLLWTRPPLTRGSFRAVVCGHTPTRSRHIEEEGGIFRTDVGLGFPGAGQVMEILKLDTTSLDWSAVQVPGVFEAS